MPSVQVDLRESWRIGPVEIPTRLVLAPMAGVSVQAFRRQGRRFGAGLVCSEMVSCAGLSHGNEKTLGYLRIAADEHPLAVQIFGGDPGVMAEAARMVEDAGADLVDINFGCPVRKVTKTGAGATCLDEPDRACRIVAAVAEAISIPVSVKMRRGILNGSRTCLDIGPRLVEAGAATLTLHPRSARQMYTGEADHSLTAELVELVDVPVIASGDIVSRARAQTVLATTGRGGGHGRPRGAGESVGAAPDHGRRRRAEPRGGRSGADPLHPRDRARARRADARPGSSRSSTAGTSDAAASRARSSRSSSSWTHSRRSSSACWRPRRAPASSSSGSRTSCRRATRCCSTCRSRCTAEAEAAADPCATGTV